MPDLILPPSRRFTRARRWATFERLFDPIERNDRCASLIREPWEVPPDPDCRYWWTVIDPMTTGQLYLCAGFHLVNRLGYVLCRNPWVATGTSMASFCIDRTGTTPKTGRLHGVIPFIYLKNQQ